VRLAQMADVLTHDPASRAAEDVADEENVQVRLLKAWDQGTRGPRDRPADDLRLLFLLLGAERFHKGAQEPTNIVA
jgi:hypothetical protein